MEKRNKIIGILVMFVFLSVLASAWQPPSDIDMRYYYELHNGTNISAYNFYQNGSAVLDSSSTINPSQFNGSAINANSSVYWAGISTISELNYRILLYWTNITNRPTSLSEFTDDLGDRGYSTLSNFTDDLGDRGYSVLSNFTDDLGDRGYSVLSNFTDDLGDRGYSHLSNFTDDLDYSVKNVNRSDYWGNYGSASDLAPDLNDAITLQAENITGGILSFSRLPSLDYRILSNYQNISNWPSCSASQKLTANGSLLNCSADIDTTYTNVSPIILTGTAFGLQACGDSQILKYNLSAAVWYCGTDETAENLTVVENITTDGPYLLGGGSASTINLTFNDTFNNLSIDDRISIAESSLNVNSSDYWDNYGTAGDLASDLNNAVTIQAENVTGGTLAFARLPTLTDTHEHAYQNISSWPSCSAAEKLTADGTDITCSTDIDTTYTNSSFDLSQISNTGNINISDGTARNISGIECLNFASGGQIRNI